MFLRKQKDQAHGQTIIRRLARASSEKGVTRDTRPANEKKPPKGRGGEGGGEREGQSKRKRGQRALNEERSRIPVDLETGGNEYC